MNASVQLPTYQRLKHIFDVANNGSAYQCLPLESPLKAGLCIAWFRKKLQQVHVIVTVFFFLLELEAAPQETHPAPRTPLGYIG